MFGRQTLYGLSFLFGQFQSTNFRDKWPLVCVESINMPKEIVNVHIHVYSSLVAATKWAEKAETFTTALNVITRKLPSILLGSMICCGWNMSRSVSERKPTFILWKQVRIAINIGNCNNISFHQHKWHLLFHRFSNFILLVCSPVSIQLFFFRWFVLTARDHTQINNVDCCANRKSNWKENQLILMRQKCNSNCLRCVSFETTSIFSSAALTSWNVELMWQKNCRREEVKRNHMKKENR